MNDMMDKKKSFLQTWFLLNESSFCFKLSSSFLRNSKTLFGEFSTVEKPLKIFLAGKVFLTEMLLWSEVLGKLGSEALRDSIELTDAGKTIKPVDPLTGLLVESFGSAVDADLLWLKYMTAGWTGSDVFLYKFWLADWLLLELESAAFSVNSAGMPAKWFESAALPPDPVWSAEFFASPFMLEVLTIDEDTFADLPTKSFCFKVLTVISSGTEGILVDSICLTGLLVTSSGVTVKPFGSEDFVVITAGFLDLPVNLFWSTVSDFVWDLEVSIWGGFKLRLDNSGDESSEKMSVL